MTAAADVTVKDGFQNVEIDARLVFYPGIFI
jgi:hypothetical protein